MNTTIILQITAGRPISTSSTPVATSYPSWYDAMTHSVSVLSSSWGVYIRISIKGLVYNIGTKGKNSG
jgi:hypothetical protein